jgi:transposase-like protein
MVSRGRAQAVQHLIESGKPLVELAAELDVSPGQLSQWRNEQLAAGSAEALVARKAGIKRTMLHF